MSDLWHWLARDSISFFTGVLALFTGLLVFYNGRQLKLLRNEFLATHRPKIRIRQILTKNFATTDSGTQVRFDCVNVGDSPCDISEIAYQARPLAYDDRPVLIDGQFRVHPMAQTRLAAGEALPIETQTIVIANFNGDWDFAGHIKYRDNAGIVRRTGFWQRFDNRIGDRIRRMPESRDYQYED